MTCDRCYDIHLGQRNGTNNNPCQCDCHMVSSGGTTLIPFWYCAGDTCTANPLSTKWLYDFGGTDQR